MSDRDRSILREIFDQVHHEITRQDVEADYIQLIIKELEEASRRAKLNLELMEKSNQP